MMFATLVGILGNLCSGICLSAVSLLLFSLFFRHSTGSRSNFLQRLLSASFYLYASIFNRLRPYVGQIAGLDLLTPVPRTISAIILSLGLGWIVFALLGWTMPTWLLILLLLHGAFVGWSWQRIILPDNFHMGTRLE